MATVAMPISRQVRATRTAISPRLAMRIFRNCKGFLLSGRVTLARGAGGSHPCAQVRSRFTDAHGGGLASEPGAFPTHPGIPLEISHGAARSGSVLGGCHHEIRPIRRFLEAGPRARDPPALVAPAPPRPFPARHRRPRSGRPVAPAGVACYRDGRRSDRALINPFPSGAQPMTSLRRCVVLSALLAVAACKSEPKLTVVRIGQDLDRTGSIATPSWSDSIRVAVGTMNQALQPTGHGNVRFEVVDANSGNTPDMARAGAIELVKKQGAKGIITDSSQDDIAVNMLAYDNDPAHDLRAP